MQYRFMSIVAAAGLAVTALAQSANAIRERQSAAFDELRAVQPEIQFLMTNGVLDRIYGAPVGGGFSPQESADLFVKNFGDAFGMGSGSLHYSHSTPLGFGGFVVIYFDEKLDGVPVEGGRVTLLTKQQLGNPVVLGVNGARPVTGSVPVAKISEAKAKAKFTAIYSGFTELRPATKVIWHGESSQHLAWKFMALGRQNGTDLTFTVFVDAVSGQILHVKDEILELDVTGTARGWVSPGQFADWPTHPEILVGLPHLRVNNSAGGFSYTDANGNFSLTNAGTTAITASAGLTGRWSTVNPAQGAAATASANVTPPGPANLVFGAGLTEFEIGQVNAYYQVNKVHDFAKAQNPAYPGIDVSIPTNVNQASTCNANFNPGTQSIQFFAAGGGCPNTAYSSVVHHEYGHFLINRAGTAQNGYGEGMGDTVALLLADDPGLGFEFLGQGTGYLRHAINSIHYPENAGSEIHTAGMIVSGAFWETVLAFEATSGHANGLALMRLYAINSILLNPPGITPGLTIDVLTLDDNDANIGNGTPHYAEIAQGFGNKGLTAPAIVHFNFEIFQGPTSTVIVNPAEDEAEIFRIKVHPNASEPVAATARFFTRYNGGAWTQTTMLEYEDPAGMLAMVDKPTCGGTLDWYMTIQTTTGVTVSFPAGGASAPFSVLGARSFTNIFTDTFETAQAWSIVNTSLTSGAWVRADPIGTVNGSDPSNPENDSPDAGANCMFTGQGAVGGAAGTADVDGGPTVLTSPAFDLSGGDGIITYNRWFYSVNGVPDTFTIQISNNGGASWVTLENVSGVGNNSWIEKSFRAGQFVTPTNNMRVRFSATDNPNDSLTEAGVDNVRITKINCN